MRENGRFPFVLMQLLTQAPQVKVAVAAMVAVWAWVFPLSTARELAFCVLLALVFDTFTGVVAAMAMGKPIESHLFGRVAIKVLCYYGAAFVIALCGKTLPGDAIFVPGLGASVVFGAVLVTETISVIENLRNTLNANGIDTRLFDAILNRLKNTRDGAAAAIGGSVAEQANDIAENASTVAAKASALATSVDAKATGRTDTEAALGLKSTVTPPVENEDATQ